MRLLRDTSISRKLKVVILATTSLALLIASAAFVAYDLFVFRQSMASDLSTLAKVIGTNSTAALAFNDHESAKDVLSALTAKQNIVRARVYTSDSDLFAEYVRAGETGNPTFTVLQQSQAAFSDNYLIVSELIGLDGEIIGTVYLISNLDAVSSRLNRFAGVVGAVLLGSLLVAFLLSSKFQGLISNPISHLARTARAVSVDKDYTIRAIKHGRDEMGMLIDGFNEMLDQIQERDAMLQNARDELEQRVEERTRELQDEIAGRKRIEELVRSSEEHFRSLIENGSDMIAVVNLDGTLRYVSPSVKRVLGYEPDQIVGEVISKYAHPDDKTATSLFSNGTGSEDSPAESVELRFKHHNGDWRTLEVVGRLVQGDSGPAQIIINSRDITERKRAESELRMSEGYRGIVWEGALNPMRLTDAEGYVVLVNDAYCKLMERPRAELEGCLLSAAYLEERSASILQKHRERFRSRSLPPNVESQVMLWNEKRLFLEVSFSFLSRFEDSPLLLSVFRDVTQSKQAEASLRESEAVFRSLAESVSAAIYIYRDSNYIYLNPAAETISGYTRDELMEMEVWDIVDPDFREAIQARASLRLQGEQVTQRSEIKIRTKRGEARWLDLTASLIQFQGEPAVLATAFDITERKGWEDAIRESEEKYRTILQSIQEGYFEVDLRGNLTFFNDSLCRIVGSPAEELMGLNNRDYTDPEAARKLYAAYNQVYRTGEPLEGFQHKIITSNGAEKFLESSILLKRDATGEISGFRGTVRDVSERMQSERALRESEERYKTLFESAPDAIMIFEADGEQAGRIVAANPAAAENTGYSVDELLSLTIGDLQPPEQIPITATTRQNIIEGQHVTTELLRLRKDGSTFPIEIKAGPLTLGEKRYVLSFGRDITQRMQTEKEVAMLAHAVRSIQECVSITDTNQVALFVNDAFVRTYGLERDEVIGKNIIDLIRVNSCGDYDDPLDGGGPQTRWEGELLNRRKDGTVFPIHLRVSPIHDDSGQIIALAGVAQDISERKQIEKEVTMLAHAMRSINEFIVVLDLAGNIIFVNDAVLKKYGYRREELIGNHLTVLHSKHAAPELVTDIIHRARFSGFDGELISKRKDGSEFPIYLSASEIQDESGKSVALVGVSQDITERKRTIEELKKAKEAAESASRAKSEFLANMSHEIRTPMNGIIGMTELALDTDLSGEQREYLKLVKLSADSLLGVINDILDFSKIEAGKLELDLDEFNLQDAIDDVMKALGVRAEQKGLELAYYLRPGVPEVIIGDLGRFRQILVNLVGNAIKFTDRGEVIVRVELEEQIGDEIVLHFGIRDTGIGVPAEKQKMIFESFTQADGSTTRKYGGTGLGLAISSQLVSLMDGQIWVESPVDFPGCEEPSGSMFHVTAHFSVPQNPVPIETQTQSAALIGLPVLVVDDNATNRRILEVQLANWQMSPVAVEGASSALVAIRRAEASGSPFKLALLDFHMPGTDGLTLTEQIRNMPSGEDIRIIMMSSSVHHNQARERKLGVDSSLVKPVKAAELLNVIKAALGENGRSLSRPRPNATKTANPARILVAEDSLVNQALIKRLLEKWGHTPLIAENGAQALLLLDSEEFDLVLMDLQMPELNGFEATAAIRKKEQGTTRHIPIIALTAHALKGDRERCIEAGMDDYVAKPIDSQALFSVIEGSLSQRAGAATNGKSNSTALDIDALLTSFEGDRELIMTLARVFTDSSQDQLSELSDALARGDAGGIASGAHALKGSVANFRADAAFDAAAKLESIGQNGDLSLADFALAKLETEIVRLRQDLKAFEEVSLA
jgi:two-component system, sensor histidine kinase and response regulator